MQSADDDTAEAPHFDRLREALGRALVWSSALWSCQRSLELSIKARAASGPLDLAHSSVEVEPGKVFSKAELYELSTLLPPMAAVEFASVFNPGYGSDGVVAGNQAPVSDRLRDLIIREAFRPWSRRVRFRRLVARVMDARDKVIAHRDAKGLQMTHSSGWPPTTQWSTPYTGVHELSPEEWLADVKLLQAALGVVLDALQNGVDPTDPDDIPTRTRRGPARR